MIKQETECEVYGPKVIMVYSEYEEYVQLLHELVPNIECNTSIIAEVRQLEINGEGIFYVWFSPTTTLPVLVHEAFHLVSFIFGTVQVGYDYYDHEAWAYYIEWWFKQFYKFIDYVHQQQEAAKITTAPEEAPIPIS